MYKSYKIVMFIVNPKGGESETVEHLYKEVDGKLVPMTEEEAKLDMLSKTSTTGKNDKVQSVKAMLFNPKGDLIKIEEVIKPIVVEPTAEEIKKSNAEKALADYLANPTDENLAKIKGIVVEPQAE